MEINSKHPLKKLGKNDQTAGVQVDRPALQITVNKSKRPLFELYSDKLQNIF